MEHWCMKVAGKDRSIWDSTSRRQYSFAKNSTSTDLGSNSGCYGDRSATKRHSYGSVCLLEYDTVYFDRNVPTFRRYLLPSSSGQVTDTNDEGSKIIENFSKFLPDRTVSLPVTQQISYSIDFIQTHKKGVMTIATDIWHLAAKSHDVIQRSE
jgi:hypothetical protein